MSQDEIQLRTMTPRQLAAYHNILVMGTRMLRVGDDFGRNACKLKIVKRLLGVGPEMKLVVAK